MIKNRMDQVRSGWVLLLAAVVYVISQSIFSVPGLVIGIGKGNIDVLDISNNDFLTQIDAFPWISLLTNGGGVAGAILVTWLLWKFIFKKPLREMGFRNGGGDFWFGLLLGAVSISVIFLVLFATGQVTLENSLLHPIFTTYTLTNLLLYILVGFSEEMFFRGIVVSTLQSRGNRTWTVYVVAGLVFGCAHILNPNVSSLGVVNIFLVGLLFTYMYLVTKRLWLSIGYHITWNYFQGNVFGFPVSGTTPHGIYGIDVDGTSAFLTGGSFGLEGGLMTTMMIVIGFFVTKWYADRKEQY